MVYWPLEGRCYIKAVSSPFEPLRKSQRGEVMLMGRGRWTQVLRYIVWAIVAFALMAATAQKAC